MDLCAILGSHAEPHSSTGVVEMKQEARVATVR